MTIPPVNPLRDSNNTSFSALLPGMQLAVDSTSLGEFKTCPRKYYYSILRGLQPRGGSVHLTFGIWMHSARELYEKKKVEGVAHDLALDSVLDWALRETWNETLGRPWISGHDLKTRQTLIQSIVWYLDALGRDDSFETLVLKNGKPAIELSFKFDLGLRTRNDEPILLCGHIDRIATLNEVPYILDIKTSTYAPDARWAKQFTPGNQFSIYTLAGRTAFGVQVRDLIVDGVQVGVGFSRFGRHLIPRDDETLAEWLDDASMNIAHMEEYAAAQYWPQNDTSCQKFGGCPFIDLCARKPAAREKWLGGEFEKRVWDPLRSRES
jgi:ATP-dependent exoDNAse (exonuclease V) beta subunit